MDSKNRVKRFKRAIARHALLSSSFVLTRLPFKMVRFVTHVLIAIGFIFTGKQKRVARKSLRIAFGDEKSDEEIDAIFENCFRNVGKMMIELIYFMAHPGMIKDKVVFENKEILDEAFAKGKGVIAVSAHFGNFPLMLLSLAQQGYPTNAIIRRTRDEKIEEYFQGLRTQLGLKTLSARPRTACVNDSIKALRNNEFVFIPLDQNFGSGGGVFVDFFGQQAATATGPAVFAMRTGAPIIPIFVVRQKDDTHKIIIEKPLTLIEGKDEKETIYLTISKITQIIERYIRQYPQEWGWMHRRWKSKSPERKS